MADNEGDQSKKYCEGRLQLMFISYNYFLKYVWPVKYYKIVKNFVCHNFPEPTLTNQYIQIFTLL